MYAGAVADASPDMTSGTPPTAQHLASVWQEFAPPLRAFLARRVPPGVDADDLLQDVFVRVIRHLQTLRSTDRRRLGCFRLPGMP